MAIKDNYFTISQSAKEFKVTRQTVSRWIKEGIFKSEKIGRETLLKKEEVRRFQASRLAAEDIVHFLFTIRNDFCHKRFNIDADEWVRRLEERDEKLHMILEKPDKTVRSFELPMNLEQWNIEFKEYATPILADFLAKLMPAMKEVWGIPTSEIKSSKRRVSKK